MSRPYHRLIFCSIIFVYLNMSNNNPFTEVSTLLRLISHPVRLKILQTIGRDECCVCHLEARLRLRQAYLSQHLMTLRDSGLLVSERDGRFIYYRLSNPAIMNLIQETAALVGVSIGSATVEAGKVRVCVCPKCSE